MKSKPFVMSVGFFLGSLCGAWMVAIGLRMFFEVFVNGYTVYFTNTFDLFLDWGLLLILGSCLFFYSVYHQLKVCEVIGK